MMSKRTAAIDNDFIFRENEVQVTYYTDPLCCWSWAMEPAWKRVQSEYGANMHVRYKMGGLMPSWQRSKGAKNSITRPSEMGHEWMAAAQMAGVNINSKIWITDPPTSSHPACLAVKCMQLQSIILAELYLQLLRTAVMVQGRNIAKSGILLDVAASLELLAPDFDMIVFETDLLGGNGKAAFREDLRGVKHHKILQFPTLIIRRKNVAPILLRGYQTFEDLRAAIVGQGVSA